MMGQREMMMRDDCFIVFTSAIYAVGRLTILAKLYHNDIIDSAGAARARDSDYAGLYGPLSFIYDITILLYYYRSSVSPRKC